MYLMESTSYRIGKEGASESPAKRPRLFANSQPLARRKCSLIVGGNQREGKKKVDYSILFPHWRRVECHNPFIIFDLHKPKPIALATSLFGERIEDHAYKQPFPLSFADPGSIPHLRDYQLRKHDHSDSKALRASIFESMKTVEPATGRLHKIQANF